MAESRLASNSECGGLSAVIPPPARGELVQGGGHEVLLVDGGEGEHLAVVRLEPGPEAPGPGVQDGETIHNLCIFKTLTRKFFYPV